MDYTALIRTYNSAGTLAETVHALVEQTCPPHRFVVVDSGSTDSTASMLPENSTLVRYAGAAFNYSSAINQGLPYIETEYAMIVSSHTVLENPRAMQFALELLSSDPALGAAYFMPSATDNLRYEAIGRRNFTGFNGVFNTCGVFRTALLAKRAFRPEVFSAEDQEWSRWLIETEGLSIAQITGGGMQYRNPLQDRRHKRLREQVAVAIYAKPDMLRPAFLARLCYRVVRPVSQFSERVANARLLGALLYYRTTGSVPPKLR